MKIPKKRELQQIVFNNRSDIDLQTSKFLQKTGCIRIFFFSDLVIDTIVASDNPSIFRKNLLEQMQKLIMKLMIRLKIKNRNTTLTGKMQKYQHYHHYW